MSKDGTCPRVEKLLKKAELAFNNARTTPEIMSRLAEYGYDEARVQRCQERLETLRQLYRSQLSLRSDKLAATAAYKKARRKADRHHQELVRLARVPAYRTPGMAQALRLKANGSKAYSHWSDRQDQFYTELANDEALATQLLEYGITAEKLAAGREAYQNTADAYEAREKLVGLANQALEDRNAAEADVKACLKQFKVIARMALADHHDWLDILGLG